MILLIDWLIFYIYLYLLIWLHQVLPVTRGIFTLAYGTQELSVVACELLIAACSIQFPDQGSNPGPLHWECGVSTTRPPGKSPREIPFECLLDPAMFFFSEPCNGSSYQLIQDTNFSQYSPTWSGLPFLSNFIFRYSLLCSLHCLQLLTSRLFLEPAKHFPILGLLRLLLDHPHRSSSFNSLSSMLIYAFLNKIYPKAPFKNLTLNSIFLLLPLFFFSPKHS